MCDVCVMCVCSINALKYSFIRNTAHSQKITSDCASLLLGLVKGACAVIATALASMSTLHTITDCTESLLGAALEQVTVDSISSTLTLVDCPYHERLPPPAVTRGKDAFDRGGVALAVGAVHGLDVVLGRGRSAEILDQICLRTSKSHSQNDSISLDHLLRPLNLSKSGPSLVISRHLERNNLDRLHVPRAIVDKLLGHDGVLARVLTVALLHFFLPIVGAEDTWVCGPRVGDIITLGRRLV
mmetsp:Transcript_13793/g.21834  ORF Transcript_13793/g.21834 Transcript_13793/m.21834 type:complete len:242 (-) Transcript_13793:4770-5495(-)